jgi:hypothetical protein
VVEIEPREPVPMPKPLLPLEREGRTWLEYAAELMDSRVPTIVKNAQQLITTLGLLLYPHPFWVPIYLTCSLPLIFVRMTFDVLGSVR